MDAPKLPQAQSVAKPEPVLGELFSRVYLRPSTLLPDSKKMRLRLSSFISTNVDSAHTPPLTTFLKSEGGLNVPYTGYYNFEKFLVELPISDVLGAVTLVWRYLMSKEGAAFRSYPFAMQAKNWADFVSRVFQEESLGYRLDANAGVHYYVDLDFEASRLAAISGMSDTRYAATRDAFDKAHGFLESPARDTKASVRSAFESLEILTRLMIPEAQNLNKVMIDKRLRPVILTCYSQPTDRAMVEKLIDGFASFVDSIHQYRHGQGVEDPIAPTPEVTIFVLSNVAAALRWLIFADQKMLASAKVQH